MIRCGQETRIFKAVLEYDGSDFFGWQIQPNRRTVQQEVEKAIGTITGERIRVTGAGRTDAGVHALGQVASFSTMHAIGTDRFRQALNAVLPLDIRILDLEEKSTSFDARLDAVSRTYRYVIARHPRSIGRQYSWYPKLRFNLEAMVEASEMLKGRHCWKSFSKAEKPEKDYLSTVLDVHWKVDEHEIQFHISAERFFHNMIRIILGTVFDVGRGKMSREEFYRLFEANDRRQAGTTLPPHGLFLVQVNYP